MFLQNLSNATERQVRSGSSSGKKSKKDEADKQDRDPSTRSTNNAKSGSATVKIDNNASNGDGNTNTIFKYTKDTGEIPKPIILSFLNGCGDMMLDESNIESMVDEHLLTKEPLHIILTNFQKKSMENDYSIEATFGCRYLSMLPVKYPGDKELENGSKRFMFVCMHSFVKALKILGNKNSALRTEGKMTRGEMLDFFEGCNAFMAMPETKVALKLYYETNNKPPGEKVIEIQKQVLNLLGLDAEFAISCLNNVRADYPEDPELHQKMHLFGLCAQTATQESMMTPSQRKAFYAEIPLPMHHVPHLFILHQQQQIMRQQQLSGHGHAHNHSHGHGHGNVHHPGHVPLQRSAEQMERVADSSPPHPTPPSSLADMVEAMKRIAISPEHRTNVQLLGTRMAASRERVQAKVSSWDAEKRKAYFDEALNNPELLQISDSASPDPVERLNKFVTLQDEEIDALVTLHCVVEEDAKQGGELGSNYIKIRQGGGEGSGAVGDSIGARLLSLFGSSATPVADADNTATLSAPYPPHPHSHSHGHGHGHGGVSSSAPDVSTGLSSVMDR